VKSTLRGIVRVKVIGDDRVGRQELQKFLERVQDPRKKLP
jgi:hypothetical protein